MVRSLVNCKICASRSSHICTTHSQVALDHYRCPECGLVFVGTEIAVEILEEAYAAVARSSYYEEVDASLQVKMEHSAQELMQHVEPHASVLDIGTGSGKFLKCLLDNGFTNVAGHELSLAALDPSLVGRCRFYCDSDWSTVPSEEFDVVTLLDVAEHVIDPAALFQACQRILKPGGLVYLHTPVVTPVDRVIHSLHGIPVLGRLAQAWQNGRTSIFHLQNYTPDALRRVMKAVGLEESSIRVENELSWPLRRYIRTFLCGPVGLPAWTEWPLTLFFYPFLATNLLNPNKGIAVCRKPERQPAAMPRAA